MSYSVRAFPIAELPVPGWECFFGRNDCDFHTLIFYIWVIRGKGKTILLDTGPPSNDEDFAALRAACQGIDSRSLMKRLNSLDDVYAQAGISAEDIDALLITQPITYATGGMVEQWFPRANVYISKAGVLEFILDRPGHPPAHAYFTESSWTFIRKLLIEDRLVLTDDPIDVADGICFETTGGHHPGSAGVKIATSKGRLGILETAFLQENIVDELPVGVAENVALCRKSIIRYKRECDLVLASHDNTLMQRFPGGFVA